MVVELQCPGGVATKSGESSEQALKSIYLGWTGLTSQKRPTTLINGTGGKTRARERDFGIVEIDSALARTIGISEGQKVAMNVLFMF